MTEDEDKTMIQLDKSLRNVLRDRKKDGESYNDVIRRMEENYEKYLKVKNFVLEDISEDTVQ